MAILDEDDKSDVKEVLEDLADPIDVHVFTDDDCQYCDEAVSLIEDVESLAEEIDLAVHEMDDPLAGELGADQYDGGPVTVITREDISGVRYFGIPSGQEFSSFLQDLVAVSTGETGLDESVREELTAIDEPVEITVFVTPTCPHCPRAVQTAHSLAIENEHVEANSVESQEFMELSQEFGVRGVPQINVNGTDGEFTGALPPQQFLQQVKQAL
ncbi:glutaredoxin [Halorhabdus sp. CBA1104]|uniref:protein disulfide oxidoreductase n=1 Tax=Halorhabdus sp. CBA1104 TaxID=1380432 RepID=UPI0012B31C1A|nr:thioredoxin family protein [Halorhabdus sp. CBA1104]QGN08081.1 glutaredoxin [Halorhabdus sp. CBA1104]